MAKLCSICGEKEAEYQRTVCRRCRKRKRTLRESDPEADNKKLSREVELWKAQARIYKQKYAAAMQEANAIERVVDYVKAAVQAMPEVKPRPFVLLKKDRAVTTESASLLLSDLHIGETIRKEQMGGLNEYNFEEFVRRYQYVIDKTIRFAIENMAMHQFPELEVQMLGDMVSGIIHEELSETNCLNIVEQAHLGALVVAQGLIDLAQHFPLVKVHCVSGNHGRLGKQKRFKEKQILNWDYEFYTVLALLLQNQKNIRFNIPLAPWASINVQGHRFLMMHGDDIVTWMGIPWYGIIRASARWQEIETLMRDGAFGYFTLAHFHNKGTLQGVKGEIIINGSMIGGNELIGRYGFRGPVQLLFGVHQRYGKTWELPINPQWAPKAIRYKYDRTKNVAAQTENVYVAGKGE